MSGSEQATTAPAEDVVDPTIGAHISLCFSTAPDQEQVDQAIAAMQHELGVSLEKRQQLDNGRRIIFVPSGGGALPEDEERLEAVAALFGSWVDRADSTVEAWAIVQ